MQVLDAMTYASSALSLVDVLKPAARNTAEEVAASTPGPPVVTPAPSAPKVSTEGMGTYNIVFILAAFGLGWVVGNDKKR